jgi:hypothetical protein
MIRDTQCPKGVDDIPARACNCGLAVRAFEHFPGLAHSAGCRWRVVRTEGEIFALDEQRVHCAICTILARMQCSEGVLENAYALAHACDLPMQVLRCGQYETCSLPRRKGSVRTERGASPPYTRLARDLFVAFYFQSISPP